MIDQKQQEKAEYFNYLGSVINDARCTPEMKFITAMEQAGRLFSTENWA
jgi:hypothetical protein